MLLARMTAVAIIAASLMVTSAANAVPTLDQNNTSGTTTSINPPYEWLQEVTAGLAGQLLGVNVYGFADVTDGGADNTFGRTSNYVRIALGNFASHGSYLFNALVDVSGGLTYVDLTSANISLSVGQQFVIDIGGAENSLVALGAVHNLYGGGNLYFANEFNFTDLAGLSLKFQTIVDAAPPDAVPVPGALALLGLGLGLLGIGGLRRKKLAA